MRVAVIGAGIAGLGAAYALRDVHDVTVFEARARLGGHARTVEVATDAGRLGCDTGFLVYNETTYPNLTRLFAELDVVTQPSEMSFSVRCRRHRLCYSGRSLIRQLRHLTHPGFARLAVDILRWQRIAPRALAEAEQSTTLGAFVTAQGLSEQFLRHFLLPFTAALWSTGPTRALDLPAAFTVRFLQQHGMLGWRGRLPWRTVTGGSARYVARLTERIGPTRCHTAAGVRSVQRHRDGVELRTDDDRVHEFDQVIIATHADRARELLLDATDTERDVLGRFEYTSNETILHTDERLLPDAADDVSSWNFACDDCAAPAQVPTVTYSLNRLQGLASSQAYCVSLNSRQRVREETIIDRTHLAHPLFGPDTPDAQRALRRLSGDHHTHYAGAHFGYGFHEDALASGLRAATALGGRW